MEDHPKGWITHEGLVVNGRKGMYHELLPHPATADATDAAGGDAAGGGGAGALGEGGQSSQVEQEGAGEGVDDDETAAAGEDSVRTHTCFFVIERQTKPSSKHYRFGIVVWNCRWEQARRKRRRTKSRRRLSFLAAPSPPPLLPAAALPTCW